MSVAVEELWGALKRALIAAHGREGAAGWMEHAAAAMRLEADCLRVVRALPAVERERDDA